MLNDDRLKPLTKSLEYKFSSNPTNFIIVLVKLNNNITIISLKFRFSNT